MGGQAGGLGDLPLLPGDVQVHRFDVRLGGIHLGLAGEEGGDVPGESQVVAVERVGAAQEGVELRVDGGVGQEARLEELGPGDAPLRPRCPAARD